MGGDATLRSSFLRLLSFLAHGCSGSIQEEAEGEEQQQNAHSPTPEIIAEIPKLSRIEVEGGGSKRNSKILGDSSARELVFGKSAIREQIKD